TIGADGKQRIWVRPLDSLSAQPLAGTEGASYPFWSPDGQFIGFFADRKLKKTEAAGGAVQTICDAPDGRGADWSPDGTVIFTSGAYGGLSRVAAGGGSSIPLEPDPGAGISHRLPQFLPDGRHLLFFSTAPKERGISIFDLQTRRASLLLRNESEAHYVEPGYLVFVRERNLMVQRLDVGALRTIGEATPIAEGVQFNPARATGGFSLAGTRLLVYQTGRGEDRQLTWLDWEGKRIGTIGEAAPFGGFKISPDGERIVAVIQGSDGGLDLWMIDAKRGVRTRFTFGIGNKISPVWSPDGQQVAYAVDVGARTWRLLLKDAGGAGKEQELFSSGDPAAPLSWSPDAQTLAFRTQSSQTKSFDVWLLSLGDRKVHPFLATSANEYGGRFSPDGKWFAYVSDESGKTDLDVVPNPGCGGKWQISPGGMAFGGFVALSNFAWLSNYELMFASGEKRYAMTLAPRGQALEIGVPRAILGETPVAGLPVTG